MMIFGSLDSTVCGTSMEHGRRSAAPTRMLSCMSVPRVRMARQVSGRLDGPLIAPRVQPLVYIEENGVQVHTPKVNGFLQGLGVGFGLAFAVGYPNSGQPIVLASCD